MKSREEKKKVYQRKILFVLPRSKLFYHQRPLLEAPVSQREKISQPRRAKVGQGKKREEESQEKKMALKV